MFRFGGRLGDELGLLLGVERKGLVSRGPECLLLFAVSEKEAQKLPKQTKPGVDIICLPPPSAFRFSFFSPRAGEQEAPYADGCSQIEILQTLKEHGGSGLLPSGTEDRVPLSEAFVAFVGDCLRVNPEVGGGRVGVVLMCVVGNGERGVLGAQGRLQR